MPWAQRRSSSLERRARRTPRRTAAVRGARASVDGPAAGSEPQTTGAYVYLKKDARKPASWENSTQQYLVATWPGRSWREPDTLDEVRGRRPGRA